MTAPNWFIALVVPPEAGWHGFGTPLPAGVRGVPAQDLHLTLAFLGSCEPAEATAAWQALAALSSEPLRARAGAWRAFGPKEAPSAYGLTLAQGHEQAARLIGLWGAKARRAAGLTPERRVPLPHVTVARSGRRQAAALRSPMERWMATAAPPAGDALLSELGLYTWHRQRGTPGAPLFELAARRLLEARGAELAAPGSQLEADV
ncbi:MAG: 2'-5' RNA ligase family protein [Prochlorococcaceae cyanobacterium]